MQSQLARTTFRAAAAATGAAPSRSLVAPRAFTTSAVARLATPQTGPTSPGHAPLHAAPVRKQRDQFALETPDYSKGPSALDKAASLFFFTEIVRGELVAFSQRILYPLTRLTRSRLLPSLGMAVVLEQVRTLASPATAYERLRGGHSLARPTSGP